MNARIASLLIAAALLLAASGPGAAQAPAGASYEPVVPAADVPGALYARAPYRAAAAVRHIELSTGAAAAPADGQTAVPVHVVLSGADGQPLSTPVLITVEVSGDSARLQLPGATTDELGERGLDADRTTRGTQITVVNGATDFNLLAPSHAGDVRVRVTAGEHVVSRIVRFHAEARSMIAAGLVEGAIEISSHSGSVAQPAGRLPYGFETQLSRWTRTFNDGRDDVALRGAGFAKGIVHDDVLLTAAFDSDKVVPARLLAGAQPDQFFPVTGDASIQGFDARSSQRLYLRLDQDRSFLLYGDFNTGNGFVQQAQGGASADPRIRLLGAYSRTMTGLQEHYETARGFANVYATRDTLKQVVEEHRANGTSGPFLVQNSSALENSEKVEIIVRDRNQLGIVVSRTVLERYVDYTFEPFSRAILFKAPIASLDSSGNPQSVRISYEVDQGGPQFWLYGADGEANVTHYLTVGGSIVEDRNPTAPYRLDSVNAQAKLGPHSTLTAEFAQSNATTYRSNGQSYTNPTGAAGETVSEGTGQAERLQFAHTEEHFKASAWLLSADRDFQNPTSGVSAGQREYGGRGTYDLGERLTLRGEALRSEDTVADASRSGGLLGLDYRIMSSLKLLGGVRYANEHGLVGSQSFIGANPSPGSLYSPQGGFSGGVDASQVNPLTGQAITRNGSPTVPGQAGPALDGTFAYLGAELKPVERLTVSGRLEEGVTGDASHRYEAGAAWQVAERSRLYVRGEDQTGLSSAYSLNHVESSRSVVAGVDTTYLQDSNGSAAAYSEYRMLDATSGLQAQEATGLRNTWVVAPGLNVGASAEYLAVQSNTAPGAVSATTGVDYTGSRNWKASGRLEWRHLYDAPGTVGADGQKSTLATVALARRIDRDWTLLARDYYLIQNNHTDSLGNPKANAWQNRVQLGVAFRPVDDNRLDVLGMLQYQEEQNIQGDASGVRVEVASILTNWHPRRPWWLSTRLAVKEQVDRFSLVDGGGSDRYTAWLAGGRLLYDIEKRWDLGVQAYTLRSNTGRAEQYALGLEVGRLVAENLWLSLGYDFTGFRDQELAGSDYTQQGIYLRIRFKFTQDLFKGGDRGFNPSLSR
jgi:hypothetical protein